MAGSNPYAVENLNQKKFVAKKQNATKIRRSANVANGAEGRTPDSATDLSDFRREALALKEAVTKYCHRRLLFARLAQSLRKPSRKQDANGLASLCVLGGVDRQDGNC